MRQPAQKTKPRISQPFTYAAPTKGWIANENLADPTPGGAAMLENWFPTATSLRVRGGNQLYATLGDGTLPVTAIFSYLNGAQRKLFAATETTIYDITVIISPSTYNLVDEDDDDLVTDEGDFFGEDSTFGLDVFTGATGGDWSVVQFATAGGVFLAGVNGKSEAFLYDGTNFYPITAAAVFELAYDAETAPFTQWETLTGGTSGATAPIVKVIDEGTSGSLWIRNIVGGPFEDDEAITDGEGGAAVANGVAVQIAPAITGVPTSDLIFVWAFKNRLWFIEKESLDAWYLPVDAVGGALVKFPMGAIFGRGGSLLFGATWSLDSGAEGGLSEQCVFVTTEGEVAVFQGTDPSSASTWSKVGVYRIGRPLGPKAFIRAGGDLVIATDIGFVPLSQAIQRDIAALSPGAVSFPIETAWNARVDQRSSQPWHSEVWPTKQMVVIALPTTVDAAPEMLVANARTGAWALYTGWRGTCLGIFSDRLFFGSEEGKVIEADVTGSDSGAPYTATCVPLFSDQGSPASRKIVGTARATLLAPQQVFERLSMQVDFQINLPPAPDASPSAPTGVWGSGVWGTSQWGQVGAKRSFQAWQSVSGYGYALAPAIQITSGSLAPPEVELVRIDITARPADVMS